jgi:hypothetical protein
LLSLPFGFAQPASAQVGEDVVWRNAVGVTVTGASITKTAATAWGNAGASSVQTLESGGYVEFTTSSVAGIQMIGLGSDDVDQGYADIEYAFYLYAGTIQVYESGNLRGSFGSYTTADRFRVEVAQGQARYLKNGVAFYTSTVAPRYPLVVDSALYSTGAQFPSVQIGRLVWAQSTGLIETWANSLKKSGSGAAGWNASAFSAQSIVSGDGALEYVTDPQGGTAATIVGLSHTGAGLGYAAIDFGLEFTGGSGNRVQVVEGGVLRMDLGASTPGAYRVEVRNQVVRYLRDGSLLYTSSVSPQYPMHASASINTPGGATGNMTLKRVLWSNPVGVSESGSSLVKVGGTQAWDAGAISSTLISGSGYVEFTALETSTYRMCGLGNADSSPSYLDIEFAIYLTGSASVQVYESGGFKGDFGAYQPGDRFRVEVSPGIVRYRKNGVVFYTSAVSPTYPLTIDTSLYSTGATLNSVSMGSTTTGTGGTVSGQVVWSNDGGIRPMDSGFQNVATGWGLGGAASSVFLPSGDGSVSATVQETTTAYMFGLGVGDSDRSYADIEYGIYPQLGTLQVYESGTLRGSFGTYAPGDRLSVELTAGTVRYKRNGTTVYTSLIAPTYPLVVDTAAYNANALLADVRVTGFTELSKVPAPQFSPAPGYFNTNGLGMSVTITESLPTAVVRYTTDGSQPGANSPV